MKIIKKYSLMDKNDYNTIIYQDPTVDVDDPVNVTYY